MSTLRVNNISTTSGTPSASTTNLTYVANRNDVAYAQINKIAAQTFGSGHQNILWDEVTTSKNISLSGNQIYFAVAGTYQITVGMRVGSATDSWTGANVYYVGGNSIVAKSYGTGNVANDPGPFLFNMLVDIAYTAVPYQVRLYRNGGSLTQATPDTEAGRAIVMTIIKVS